MNIITVYVQAKENLSREIGELTAQYFLEGLSYEEALEKAKEYGHLRENKCSDMKIWGFKIILIEDVKELITNIIRLFIKKWYMLNEDIYL